MDEHERYKDDIDYYWWIYCPKEDERMRLAKKPDFCPCCGESLKHIN